MTRGRPEAEQIGAVVERLSVLIAAGVTPQDAWRHLAESRRSAAALAAAGRAAAPTPGHVAVTARPARASGVDAVIRSVVHDIDSGRPIADAIAAAASPRPATPEQQNPGARAPTPTPAAARGGRGAGAVHHGRNPGLRRSGDTTPPAAGPRRSSGVRGLEEVANDAVVQGRSVSGRASGEFTAEAAWSALAAAWFIASEAGAPLAACLDDIARCLLAAGEVERDTAAALAGPVATTRLVIALPLVSILSGAVLGLDTLRILFTTPAGLACLVAGGLLLLIARAWSARLLRRARRVEAVPGLALDLVAVAASGGGSLSRAVDLVDDAFRRFEVAAANDPRAVEDVLQLAARAGAPPGELLKAEALRARRDSVGLARRRAAALDVWLMLPLGLCVLPAFVLLAVAPVVVGVLSTLSLT